MKKIVHISPTIPPSINGLGDFCYILVEQLKAKGIDNNYFLICDKPHDSSLDITERRADVGRFNPSNFSKKLMETEPEVILLHYVGYAYDSKGLPFYLVEGIEKAIVEKGCKLLIFFHELYSSSNSPLDLPFYTSFFQKKIVKRLYNLATTTFTNCTIYEKLLRRLTTEKSNYNICTGIFSNIPDELYKDEVTKDPKAAVVFGTLIKRQAVYLNPIFNNLLGKLGVTTVYDIGPGKFDFSSSNINYCKMGSLPSTKVANCLNKSTFGAIDYPSEVLGKSGIFAAYAAFGIIPINFSPSNSGLYDDLIRDKNYFDLKSDLSLIDPPVIKNQMLAWYEKRSSKSITETIAKFIY